MKSSVIVFPGSNCDSDCYDCLNEVTGGPVTYVWHKEEALPSTDLVVIPGGFSYGDYLRAGAIARFSPIMKQVVEFANAGGAVIGICNGFQVLLEAGLLEGAMRRNENFHFICKNVYIRTEQVESIFSQAMNPGQVLSIPIAHGEGNYYCDDQTLSSLKKNDQILFRYSDVSGQVDASTNPNGSVDNIAGILNQKKNVLGMMPHPERASDALLGSVDGRFIWESLITCLV